MVTPRFSLRQDDEFVMVDMRVPGHVKLGEDDVYMEGKAFMFHAHPYFLRFVFLVLNKKTKQEELTNDVCVPNETVWNFLEMLFRMEKSMQSLTARTTG